jgi:uncharacterized protein (DUF58 family)
LGNTDKGKKSKTLYDLLADADTTYSKLPPNVRLRIEKISQGLMEFGPRKLKRPGLGTEFYEARAYRPGVDTVQPNAKLSARADKPIVVENEAEIRQHFYLWRDAKRTDFRSRPDLLTVKESEEVMLLAMAKHLAKNEEMIGILDREGQFRGGSAPEWLGQQLFDVNIMTGDMPMLGRSLPKNSTVILFSDFMMDPDELIKGLDQLHGTGLRGFLVMVLDPEEIEFNNFKGHIEFKGYAGEGKIAFKKAESLQKDYREAVAARIKLVEKLAEAKGFQFVLQRTDKKLEDGLMAIYGLAAGTAPNRPSLDL